MINYIANATGARYSRMGRLHGRDFQGWAGRFYEEAFLVALTTALFWRIYWHAVGGIDLGYLFRRVRRGFDMAACRRIGTPSQRSLQRPISCTRLTSAYIALLCRWELSFFSCGLAISQYRRPGRRRTLSRSAPPS